jgi:hypothetical protein
MREKIYVGNVELHLKTLDFSDGKCSTSKDYVTINTGTLHLAGSLFGSSSH